MFGKAQLQRAASWFTSRPRENKVCDVASCKDPVMSWQTLKKALIFDRTTPWPSSITLETSFKPGALSLQPRPGNQGA